METFEDKVFRTIRKHQMFAEGDNVIVALSGGADSVALFHFLCTHRQVLGITLAAAHLEHGLRGEQSLKDMDYVRSLSTKNGVEVYTEHAHMAERERPRGIGVEEWGRRLRYAFFECLHDEYDAKIAIAHTLSDNAETVLFRAIRGTGPRGLGGIPPVRDFYVRPLITISRAGVEAYCKANGLAYIHDHTNDDTYYSRNSLRHEVMPLLEKAHSGAENNLARMATDMRELDDWLTRQAAPLLEQVGGSYDAEAIYSAPSPLRLKALAMLAGPKADRAALDGMLRVLAGELGAVQLPGGAVASVVKGRLYLRPAGAPRQGADGAETLEQPLREGVYRLPGGYHFNVRVADAGQTSDDLIKSTQKGLTFAADYDKIPRYSVFRGRKARDSFSPAGRGVTKPLRKWMNEAGIPPWERDTLPLLADDGRVLWVWGHGFCHGLRPDGDTSRILVITAGDGDGGI